MLEIMEVDQWILWGYDGDRKRPISPNTGRWCGSTHEHEYCSYEFCREQLRKFEHAEGLGFCFTPEDPYLGIDLDNCTYQDMIAPWAYDIISKIQSYWEISPSREGLKCWVRAKKPEGYPSRAAVDDGSIEVYESGRFFTFTGLESRGSGEEIIYGQDGVDWLFETYYRQKPTSGPTLIPFVGDDHLMRRAIAYVDSCSLPVVGDRNNWFFRTSGGLRALEHEGRRLSDDQVLGLMRNVNHQLNGQALSDEELESAVTSSAVNGTPREAKPTESVIGNEIPIDSFKRLLAPAPIRNEIPIEDLLFPQKCLEAPGLIGNIVKHNLASAWFPQPEFALGGALAMMGLVTSRKVAAEFMGTTPNMYVVCLGGSSTGKEHARKVNYRIASAAGITSMLGPEEFRSDIAIARALEGQPAMLCQMDEIGHIIQAIMSDRANAAVKGIEGMVLKLFSAAGYPSYKAAAYADAGWNVTLCRPHLSIYGTCTPQGFWEHLTLQALENGFISRWSVFEGDWGEMVEPERKMEDIPEGILKEVEFWKEFRPPGGELSEISGKPAEVPMSNDARERMVEHMRNIRTRGIKEGVEERAAWGKTAERSAKYALLFACSRNRGQEIGLEDVDLGIALANHQTRRVVQHLEQMSETQFGRNVAKAIEAVKRLAKKDGGTITDKKLRETRPLRDLPGRDKEDLTNALVERGILIGEGTGERGGRIWRVAATS